MSIVVLAAALRPLPVSASSLPYAEDFEGTFYANWDTFQDNGNPNPFYSSAHAYNGSQSMNMTLSLANNFHWVVESVSGSPNPIFQQCYVYIGEIPQTSAGLEEINGLGLRTTAGGAVANTGFYNDSGTCRWVIMYKDGGVYTFLESDAATINVGQWYCIEFYFYGHGTAGNCTLWVDGVSVISENTLDTDDYLPLTEMGYCVWCRENGARSSACFDCYKSDDEYIGVPSEGQDLTFTRVGNLLLHGSMRRGLATAATLSGVLHLLTSGAMHKAVGFAPTSLLRLWAASTASIDTFIQDLTFTLYAAVHLAAATAVGKALTFPAAGVLRLWGAASMATEGIAQDLAFIVGATLRLAVAMVATTAEAVLLLDVLGLAAIAFILAIVALVLVLALNRD